jgi:hypothetical protein
MSSIQIPTISSFSRILHPWLHSVPKYLVHCHVVVVVVLVAVVVVVHDATAIVIVIV